MDHKKMLKLKSQSHSQPATTPAPTTTALGTVRYVTGAKTSRKDLRLRGARLVAAIRAHQAEMTAAGYPPEKVDAFLALLVQFDATGNESQKVADKQATQTFYTKVNEAIVFREKLIGILRAAAVTRPEFLAENPLLINKTYSGPQVARWLGEIQGVVTALQPELVRVSSVDWSAQVSAQEAALTEAVGAYELYVSQRKDRAAKRLAARNALTTACDEAQAFAVYAFAGNPTVLKQFQKTNGSRKKAKASTPAEGSSTAQGGATAASSTSSNQSSAGSPPGSPSTSAAGATPAPKENTGVLVPAPVPPPAGPGSASAAAAQPNVNHS